MSNKRTAISENQFTVQIKSSSRFQNTMYVPVLENAHFNLNGNLTKALAGHEIAVRFTADYQHLLLSYGEGLRFPKSGSCKWAACSEALTTAGIALPARYEVWKRDKADLRQGDLIENSTKKPSVACRNSKKS